MRSFWSVVVWVILAVHMDAQQAIPAGGNASAPAANQAIVVVRAILAEDVDARKLHEGEPIQAVVLQDVKVGDATIGKGAKILGHAGQVRRKVKGEDSALEIVFDKAVLKDGSELSLLVSIQAIGPRLSSDADEPSVAGSSAEATDHSGCVPGMDALRSSMGQTAESASRGHRLPLTSVGIVGLRDLALTRYARSGILISQITSAKRDVRLDRQSQMILRVGIP